MNFFIVATTVTDEWHTPKNGIVDKGGMGETWRLPSSADIKRRESLEIAMHLIFFAFSNGRVLDVWLEAAVHKGVMFGVEGKTSQTTKCEN